MLTAEHYTAALTLSNTHRFAEIAETFAKVAALVDEEAQSVGKTRRWTASHPIVRLYMEQLLQLSGNGPGPHHTWRAALNFAQKAALGRPASVEIGGHHYRFPSRGDSDA